MPLPKKQSCECIDAERPWGVSWVYQQAVFWTLGPYASCSPVHGELTLYAQGKTRLTAVGRSHERVARGQAMHHE